MNEKPYSSPKNLHENLRIWFKIILGCIHPRPSLNSQDYINTDQKYMLYYLSSGNKINFPSILFKYLREMVKETRNGTPKLRKWIPLGSSISDILFESKLVHKMMEVGMTKEVDFEIGKNFNGGNLKNMSLITTVVGPLKLLDKKSVGSRRIPVDDYSLFSKEEYK